ARVADEADIHQAEILPPYKEPRQRSQPPQIEGGIATQAPPAAARTDGSGSAVSSPRRLWPRSSLSVPSERAAAARPWGTSARDRASSASIAGAVSASAVATASRTKLDGSAAALISAPVSPLSPSRPSARAAIRRSPQLGLASAR